MFAQQETITVTTDASGNATAFTANDYSGVVRAVVYTKVGFSNGSTFTITGNTSGQTIWTQTGVNASTTVCPKQATHSTAGVAALYAAAGTAVNADVVLASEKIKIVISGGGNAVTGTFCFVVG